MYTKKKQVRRVIISFLCLIVLQGCANTGENPQTNGVSVTKTFSQDNNSQMVQLPDLVHPEDGEELEIGICCEDGNLLESPPNFGIDGVIGYYDIDAQQHYLIGSHPLSKIPIGISEVENRFLKLFSFSPNGEWLAFGIEESNVESYIELVETDGAGYSSFYLLSSGGDESSFAPDESETNRAFGIEDRPSFYLAHPVWVNDDVLLVNFINSAFAGELTEGYYEYQSIFDLTDEEWDHVIIKSIPNRSPLDMVNISRDFSRAVYFNQNGQLVLWDIENKSIVKAISNISFVPVNHSGNLFEYRLWSPGSMQFGFIKLQDSLDKYTLSRDGIMDLISPFPSLGYDLVNSTNYSWDSKSQSVVFSLGRYSQTDGRFVLDYASVAVYDINDREIIYDYKSPFDSFEPLFSPDGKYIVFIGQNENTSKTPLIVLNLESGRFYKLAENASQLSGWSDKFTVE